MRKIKLDRNFDSPRLPLVIFELQFDYPGWLDKCGIPSVSELHIFRKALNFEGQYNKKVLFLQCSS